MHIETVALPVNCMKILLICKNDLCITCNTHVHLVYTLYNLTEDMTWQNREEKFIFKRMSEIFFSTRREKKGALEEMPTNSAE